LTDFRDKVRKVKKEIQAYIIRGERIPNDVISKVESLESEALGILRTGDLKKICPTCIAIKVEHVAEW